MKLVAHTYQKRLGNYEEGLWFSSYSPVFAAFDLATSKWDGFEEEMPHTTTISMVLEDLAIKISGGFND